jgi:TPR repeat protein
VPQDQGEAARWYRKAADQGFANAQHNLGYSYVLGRGVPQDYAEAVRWYRKAAAQGLAHAQFNLGRMYDHGQGVPQDFVEAHMWLNLAASRASGDNEKKYEELRELVAKSLTSQQIAAAQRRARVWKPRSAEPALASSIHSDRRRRFMHDDQHAMRTMRTERAAHAGLKTSRMTRRNPSSS